MLMKKKMVESSDSRKIPTAPSGNCFDSNQNKFFMCPLGAHMNSCPPTQANTMAFV